jgi:hypothetical protein
LQVLDLLAKLEVDRKRIVRKGMALEYPKGFPPDCQDAVEVEKVQADYDFRLTEQTLSLEDRALRWVFRVLGAFACEARGLVITKRWTLAQLSSALEEFNLDLVRQAHYGLSCGRLNWVDRVFGTSIRPDVREAIEKSAQWQNHLTELVRLAAGQRHRGFREELASDRTGLPAFAVELTPDTADEATSRQLRIENCRKNDKARRRGAPRKESTEQIYRIWLENERPDWGKLAYRVYGPDYTKADATQRKRLRDRCGRAVRRCEAASRDEKALN